MKDNIEKVCWNLECVLRGLLENGPSQEYRSKVTAAINDVSRLAAKLMENE
ncbi:MAG: hypothetical protein O7D95_03000 [Betaproteobacteria bacterium]|nr:hypothetical protein [Betaproteobacteria bacterium]